MATILVSLYRSTVQMTRYRWNDLSITIKESSGKRLIMRQSSAGLWGGALASPFSWPPSSHKIIDGESGSWYKQKVTYAVETRSQPIACLCVE
jgi:hypothetical protein